MSRFLTKNASRRLLFLAVLALILAILVWLVPQPLLRYTLSFSLLWVLPGLAWLILISPAALTPTEKIVTGLGFSFVVTPVLTLLLSYLEGPLSRELLLLALLAAILLPLILSLVRQKAESSAPSQPDPSPKAGLLKNPLFWLLLVILLAAVVRLVNLDYSEFQGDEAAVLVRSARILTGEDGELFQHKKGPAELLLVMSGWSLTGITNEWMARLPFAWASILGVAGVFLFGRRLGHFSIGLIAASLLAIEGYLVGFGRIVQYQSIVFALSTLALLCLLAYARQRTNSLILLAAAFFAIGSWAHYDALLFLPAGLLLIGYRLLQDRHDWRKSLPYLLAAGIVGLLLLALFYVPFFRDPQVEGTLFYLTGRVGSDQFAYNHLPSTFDRTFVYDSLYFILLVACAVAAQVILTWRRWGRAAVFLAVALLLLLVTTLFYPQWWQPGETNAAWLPAFALWLGALLAPRQEIGKRAVWLWLGVPALFYLYFVALPLTHVYTAVPATALLAGLGLYNLGRKLAKRSPTAVRIAAATAVALFLLALSYTMVMFVSHSPEYLRTYPESKALLYWTPYGAELPQEGLFGFPYRAGWKAVGYLLDTGELAGSYDSNEERDITDFYTRQARRFDCATPDLYVTAENVQDEVTIRADQLAADYAPALVVSVAGAPKMTIHQQGPTANPSVLPVEEVAWRYDLGSTPAAIAAASPAIAGSKPPGFTPLDAQIGDFAHLVGYQVDTTHARPGGFVELQLLWQPLSAAPIDYQIFTHLHDGEQMRGQLDGQPVCNSAPTSRWQSGTYIVDPYRIPLHPDSPTGSVPLTVGMYDLTTLQRLPALDSGDESAQDTIFITNVDVRENE